MSNTESFIDEVTEEVRRERMFLYVRRYGWIALVGVLAIVGGAAFNEWQKAQTKAKSEALGGQILTAAEIEDPAARQAAFAAIAAEGNAAAVTALMAADEAVRSGDAGARSAALAQLAAVGKDASLAPIWRDLAELRRVMIAGAELAGDQRKAVLDALATPGRPYRPLALEQIALDKLAAGERDAALADFRALQAESTTPSALRARAGQMIVVLGGAQVPAQN